MLPSAIELISMNLVGSFLHLILQQYVDGGVVPAPDSMNFDTQRYKGDKRLRLENIFL